MDKTATIATALLLTAISVALALWADVLKIHVEVNTGNVDVEFGTATVTEYVGFPDGNGGWSFVPEGSTSEAKNVGQCAATFTEVENEEGTSLGQQSTAGNNDADLVITISNGYPGYNCTVAFTVVNTGSVPVKLYFYYGGSYVTLPYSFSFGGPNNDAVTCVIKGDNAAQIHPSSMQGPNSATYTVSCRVNQSASEGSQYTTQIYIQARQWNEPLS